MAKNTWLMLNMSDIIAIIIIFISLHAVPPTNTIMNEAYMCSIFVIVFLSNRRSEDNLVLFMSFYTAPLIQIQSNIKHTWCIGNRLIPISMIGGFPWRHHSPTNVFHLHSTTTLVGFGRTDGKSTAFVSKPAKHTLTTICWSRTSFTPTNKCETTSSVSKWSVLFVC